MTRLAALVPRSPSEAHRAATPLELFVDLCFVVAIAQAAASLHHAIAEDHVSQALIGFPMVFFAIWWAWLQFTWFASGYDNDDAVYRIATFVQVAGILVLAAGVPKAFDGDFKVIVVGYVIVRLSLVYQYLRAARSDRPRASALRGMAGAIIVLQVLWVLFAVFVDRPVAAADLPGAGGLRDGGAGVEPAQGLHPVASAPHRGAIRTAHDHRPR